MSTDQITLAGLDLPTRIGVPDAERSVWQSLQAYLTLTLERPFDAPAERDDLALTVDYEAVAVEVRHLAAERPRKLLETLAVEIARHILERFAVAAVAVELRKRILPGTDYTSVRLQRERTS